MKFDFSRIKRTVDVAKLRDATVVVIGNGGAVDLIANLGRSGVTKFKLLDKDIVTDANLCRQGFEQADIGRPKAEAVADRLRRINPEVEVTTLICDFCEMTDEDIDREFGDADLFIFATDHFPAQARGNQVALRLQKPALWLGMYADGVGGEVVFWHPGIDACYRCLVEKRFLAHELAKATGQSLDPPSDGCTIFDIGFLDAIAGPLAIGLLTRGSDSRYGKLIGALGDRNFIQTQIDPDWTINGRRVVREKLGVPDACKEFFAWNTIARTDPESGFKVCPDCEQFRGDAAVPFFHGMPIRMPGKRPATQN
ncbi:MAG: hypothetical protein FJ302_13255 [Planctomycetes bacterium]|nr:hypothetical protein [Planctomycetota bacterium]